MTRGMVIVETRIIPNFKEVLMNHVKYTGWPLMIFHGTKNEEYVRECSQHLGVDVSFVNVNNKYAEMDAASYNDLLTSKTFWAWADWDKVLIFQSDSMLLRPGIEQYLQYGYVGAPWLFQQHGGNGGLSLRDKKAMIEIINIQPYTSNMGNEDVYFSNQLNSRNMKLAPRYICESFSCESIFSLGTFGCHAIGKYLSEQECNNILTQYR
jgi:hypothetical protein